MLHSTISRSVPKKYRPLFRHSGVKFSFDCLERGYLLHWALDVPTHIAIAAAILVTLAVLLVVNSIGEG